MSKVSDSVYPHYSNTYLCLQEQIKIRKYFYRDRKGILDNKRTISELSVSYFIFVGSYLITANKYFRGFSWYFIEYEQVRASKF